MAAVEGGFLKRKSDVFIVILVPGLILFVNPLIINRSVAFEIFRGSVTVSG